MRYSIYSGYTVQKILVRKRFLSQELILRPGKRPYILGCQSIVYTSVLTMVWVQWVSTTGEYRVAPTHRGSSSKRAQRKGLASFIFPTWLTDRPIFADIQSRRGTARTPPPCHFINVIPGNKYTSPHVWQSGGVIADDWGKLHTTEHLIAIYHNSLRYSGTNGIVRDSGISVFIM